MLELVDHFVEERDAHQCVVSVLEHELRRPRYDHVRERLVLGVPVIDHVQRDDDEQGGQVLGVQDEVLSLDEVAEVPRHQAPGLPFLHALQARLEGVVGLSLDFQIGFDLTNLFSWKKVQ